MKRRPRTVTNKSRAKKASGALTWKFYSLVVLGALALSGGFFLAARNHFSSITYGFKNAELRKELGNLEDEKRRLILSREVALSPSEIGKAARLLGFSPMTAKNIETYKSTEPVLAKKTAQPNQKVQVAGKIIASLNTHVPSRKESKTALISKSAPRTQNAPSRN